jgi:hypothetical protein
MGQAQLKIAVVQALTAPCRRPGGTSRNARIRKLWRELGLHRSGVGELNCGLEAHPLGMALETVAEIGVAFDEVGTFRRPAHLAQGIKSTSQGPISGIPARAVSQ